MLTNFKQLHCENEENYLLGIHGIYKAAQQKLIREIGNYCKEWAVLLEELIGSELIVWKQIDGSQIQQLNSEIFQLKNQLLNQKIQYNTMITFLKEKVKKSE
eukprot:TRINITY_DN41859_c0_g1_i1.p4 TRINITY_DN41859_c0_g1~~TRINITY_DN41859_c0_g1_i1.p4  ORF type:complete len:102 (-),score=15.87 TRINITY_DN41859_c0_g1_i1:491-796(-)